MRDGLVFALTLFSALGSGLIAGLLFGFSVLVMRALAALPPGQGIAAFQAINVAVNNPIFMTAFVGTGVLGVVAAIYSLTAMDETGAGYRLAGGLLYLIGTILITGWVHIPWNNALGLLDPDSKEAAESWARFYPTWMRWNHIRTAAALAASACFILALR